MKTHDALRQSPLPPSQSGFVVRPAKPDDLAALVELETEVFGEGWSEGALRNFLTAEADVVLLAEVGEPMAVLGYVCFLRLVDDVELLRLAVTPTARGRGIGRALVERGLDLHRPGGLVACHLEVRRDNATAIDFYQRLGFERVGARRGYYRDGCDAVLMSRAL